MNRVLGTVTVKDARGKLHVITDVDPANMEGVTLGTQIIMTYAQGVALSLEKAPAAE